MKSENRWISGLMVAAALALVAIGASGAHGAPATPGAGVSSQAAQPTQVGHASPCTANWAPMSPQLLEEHLSVMPAAYVSVWQSCKDFETKPAGGRLSKGTVTSVYMCGLGKNIPENPCPFGFHLDPEKFVGFVVDDYFCWGETRPLIVSGDTSDHCPAGFHTSDTPPPGSTCQAGSTPLGDAYAQCKDQEVATYLADHDCPAVGESGYIECYYKAVFKATDTCCPAYGGTIIYYHPCVADRPAEGYTPGGGCGSAWHADPSHLPQMFQCCGNVEPLLEPVVKTPVDREFQPPVPNRR